MSTRRLIIISRRFWPMSGPTELAVIDLACALKASGHQVEIITTRWEKNWPSEFVIRDIHATRVARPGGGPWGNFRFQRALSKYLEERQRQSESIDGAIIFGTGQETETARRILGPDIPILTRVDSRALAGVNVDGAQFKRAVAGLASANAVAVDSQDVARRLQRGGWTDVTHQIPDVVTVDTKQLVNHSAGNHSVGNRNAATRNAARRAISDAHPILSLEEDHPLVVCGLPMDGDAGLLDIVAAWPTVLKANRNAKLWLGGDGSFGRRVWDSITRRELIYSVIMPGYFDDLTELFLAADLYVHPARSAGACSILARAMSAGVCVVSTDTEYAVELIERKTTGMIVPREKPEALAEAILHALQNRDLRKRLGSAARRKIQDERNPEILVEEYLSLLTLDQPSGTRSVSD